MFPGLSVLWSLRPQNRAATATCGRGRCELPAISRLAIFCGRRSEKPYAHSPQSEIQVKFWKNFSRRLTKNAAKFWRNFPLIFVLQFPGKLATRYFTRIPPHIRTSNSTRLNQNSFTAILWELVGPTNPAISAAAGLRAACCHRSGAKKEPQSQKIARTAAKKISEKFEGADCKKGPAERGHVKKRQKSSKSVKKFFDNFRAAQKNSKSSKNVKKLFDTFRQFSRGTIFPAPFWGALPNETRVLRQISPESSAKSLSHKFFGVPFLASTQPPLTPRKRFRRQPVVQARTGPALWEFFRKSAVLQGKRPWRTGEKVVKIQILLFLP